MKDYNKKKVWIIGASSGIGAELAKKLSKEGAILALSARSEEGLKNIRQELWGDSIIFPLDVSNTAKTLETLNSIHLELNGLDSIIFMAATYSADEKEREDIDIAKRIIDINFTGALNAVFPTLEIFKKQGYGEIVICASVAGYRGLPGGQPYCATKAALINYTESLYIENKDKNIDVKLICPGFVKTRITDKNKFKMPMMISAEKAADHIVKGLKSNDFEIHFPKSFTLIMKFLRLLPNKLYFWIAGETAKKL